LNSTEHDLKITDFGQAVVTNPSSGVTVQVAESEPAVCTLSYRSPERVVGMDQSTSKHDMFSVGCIFAELLLGKVLLSSGRGAKEGEQLKTLVDVLGAPPTSFLKYLENNACSSPAMASLRCSRLVTLSNLANAAPAGSLQTNLLPFITQSSASGPAAANLLCSLLSWNPDERPSAQDVLRHPFFA
jgi:cell division cycle 2-like protein